METQITDGEAGEFGVIVCDVNGLKHINDTLGHKADDGYICSASKLLREYYSTARFSVWAAMKKLFLKIKRRIRKLLRIRQIFCKN